MKKPKKAAVPIIHKSWSRVVTKNYMPVRVDIQINCGAEPEDNPPNHRARWKWVTCKVCKERMCIKRPRLKTVDLHKFSCKTRAGYPVKNLVETADRIFGQYYYCGEWLKGYWCKDGMVARDGLYKCDVDLVEVGNDRTRPP